MNRCTLYKGVDIVFLLMYTELDDFNFLKGTRICMNNNIIFYNTPASRYLDAMPVGNGHLGAMVCGGIEKEKINLNDDTLWSGFPRANYMYSTYER